MVDALTAGLDVNDGDGGTSGRLARRWRPERAMPATIYRYRARENAAIQMARHYTTELGVVLGIGPRAVTERLVLQRWPEGDGLEMEFRLVFRGALPPDKRGTVEEKHFIRKQLHKQLRTMWLQHAVLKGLFSMPLDGHPRVVDVAKNYSRCGFQFVPLVRHDVSAACSLDFLLLRREEPFRVFSGHGDIDNRIKTFIDGLRVPQQCSEVGGQRPEGDESPFFFCLLEDDKLIFDFSVTTDRLLTPPEGDEEFRDTHAIISVKVKSTSGPFTVYDIL